MRRILALVLTLTLVVVPADAQVSIFNMRNSLVQFALSQISTENLTITAETVIEPDEGGTQIVGLKAADPEGVWLEIDRLTLNWNASRLLLLQLQINTLSASGVRVLRQPRQIEVDIKDDADADAEADSAPFSWPRAPITTRIGELLLDRVEIADGVIGEGIPGLKFDATGSAEDEGNLQGLQLRLTRTDAVEGRIAIDYSRDFAADTLALNLNAREAPGGLVGVLAGFPQNSGTQLSIEAAGPLSDWAMTFSASTDEVFVAEGTADLEFAERISALADFSVTPGPELDPTVAAVIGERARLHVDVAEDEGGVVRIRDGTLSSPALALDASGTFTRPTGALDIGIALTGEAALADLADGVAFDGFGFDGRVSGTLDDLRAAGTLTLEGLATEPVDVASAELEAAVTVAAADEAADRPQRIGFDVTGRTEGLRLDRIAPEVLGSTALVARGQLAGEALTLETLSLDNALLSVSADGALGTGEGGAAEIDYRLEAQDLAPVAAAYGTIADGAIDVTGRVTGTLAAPRIAGTIEARDLSYEGEDFGRVTATHDVSLGDAIAGTATVDASGSPYGPATVAARFAMQDEVIELSELSAEALGAALKGALTYDQSTGLADGSVTLDAPDLAPLEAISGTPARGAVSAEVTLSPENGQQRAVADIAARDVDAVGARIAQLDLEATVTDALGSPSVDGVLDATALGFEDARLARLSGRVQGSDLTGAGELVFDLTAEDGEGFDASVARARIEGTVQNPATLASLDARIEATGLGFQDAAAGTLRGTVKGTDVLDGGQVVAAITVDGARGFDAEVGALALDATVTDVQTLAGLDARIEATGLGYQDATVGTLRGTVEGTDVLNGGKVTAALTVDGARGFDAEVGALALDATVTDVQTLAAADIKLTAERLGVADISVARLQADITAADGLSPRPTADLDLAATDVRGSVATREIRVNATVRPAANTAATSDVTARARVAPLTAGEATVAAIALDATVGDALGTDPRIEAALDTGAVAAGDARLDNLRLTARGLLSALEVALAGSGEVGDTPVSLASAATVDAVTGAPTVRLTRLDAAYGEEQVSLNGPATLTAAETTTLEGLDLALPGGRLRADASLYPDGLGADLDLSIDDFAIVERFGGPRIESGALSLDATIDSRPGQAKGTLALAVSDLLVEGVETDGQPIEMALDGQWNGRTLATDMRLSGPFGDPMLAELNLPLVATGGPAPEVPPNGPLSGSLRWDGDIGQLWVLVPLPDHVLTGHLDLDFEVAGTLSDPMAGGSVRMTDGRYENLETGTILTDVSIESRVSSAGDLTLQLTAMDGASGRVEGDINFDGDELEAKITSDRAVLVRRDDVKAAISLDLTAAGPLTGPDVSGTITIDRAEIRLVNQLPPSVVTLDGVRIKGEPVPEPSDGAGGDIDLDIAVRGPRDIFIRGRGLDSEWALNLDITGTASRPRVVGLVKPVRGRLDFVGTRFDLADSTIRFTGGREIDPLLDVRLQADRNGIVGGIQVFGNASGPEIVFFSTPSLPQGEIMPRLLYGRSSQSMSATQGIQLAAGLAQLMDGSDGTLSFARGLTGLDTIDFSETEDGDAAVTVGKNLTDDVFVGATQSLDGAESEVTVEVEVYDNVIFDVEVDQEGESSFGINWRKDF